MIMYHHLSKEGIKWNQQNYNGEDVIQFEEVKGYGKSIWRNDNKYYLVSEEGTVASWLVVYELPQELFTLLESGERTLLEISWKVQNDCWPPTEVRKES